MALWPRLSASWLTKMWGVNAWHVMLPPLTRPITFALPTTMEEPQNYQSKWTSSHVICFCQAFCHSGLRKITNIVMTCLFTVFYLLYSVLNFCFLYFSSVYVFVYMMSMPKSKRTVIGNQPFPSLVWAGSLAQVFRLPHTHPYQLSYLTSPFICLKFLFLTYLWTHVICSQLLYL